MKERSYFTIPLFVVIGVFSFFFFIEQDKIFSDILSIQHTIALEATTQTGNEIVAIKRKQIELKQQQLLEEMRLAQHIQTPEIVQAVYISSWVAGTPSLRNKIIELVATTELNAVVIDIKDSTGVVSFPMQTSLVEKYSTDSSRIHDIESLITMLHEKNIYVIGRLTTFQDPLLAEKRPDWAFTRVDGKGVWRDNKGLAFIDPRKQEAWEYYKEIALEAYRIGFDEINFDYIRYPSDGSLKNLNYNIPVGETRASSLKKFYQYLDEELRQENMIPISADIFGLVTTAQDDLGIGQVFEDMYPYFDVIAPMVYPSHYYPGSFGYTDPESNPYAIVKIAMQSAVDRALKLDPESDPSQKLRTWIQDFSLKVSYGANEVANQIRASREVGVPSYMSWDPANTYTTRAY